MMQIGVRLGPDVVRLGPMGSDWVISHTRIDGTVATMYQTQPRTPIQLTVRAVL